MKLATSQKNGGFTLTETLVAAAVGSVLMAAVVTSSVALKKSFNAIDSFFSAHIQQIRVIDYLARDVKRGLSVTTTTDRRNVTIVVPKYIIEAGDPEAIANPSLVGTPRTPTITMGTNGPQVTYGSSVTTVAYSLNGSSISRTENGALTHITTSADQLVPETTNVQLANTQFSKTSVTFLPIFSSGQQAVRKTATTLCSTAYLRNKRRG